MIATLQRKANRVNPLARFVTQEAIALIVNLKSDDIYRIDCWRYVIHVVGKGKSRFVSYGDIPPILEVEPPNAKDFWYWRKRWRKNYYQAPQFWPKFYQEKIQQATSFDEISRWKELVEMMKLVSSQRTIQVLQELSKTAD